MSSFRDCHSHTYFSDDSVELPERHIEAALKAGGEYLAFTDHLNLDFAYCPSRDFKFEKLDAKAQGKKIEELRGIYGGKISIAQGAEFSYDKRCDADYKKFAESAPFDIILNSVHTFDGLDIYYGEFYTGRTQREAYELYLSAIIQSVGADFPFDVVGHMGYIERCAPYENVRILYKDYSVLLDVLLKAIVDRGCALELNSQTRQTGFAAAPDVSILKRYKELGGRLLTFGSDAHQAWRIGERFKETAAMAKEAGFDELTSYKRRKPEFYKI